MDKVCEGEGEGEGEGGGVEVGGGSMQNTAKHLRVIPCSMLLLLCGISPDPPCPLRKEASQMQPQTFLCMFSSQRVRQLATTLSDIHGVTQCGDQQLNHYSLITLFTSFIKLDAVTFGSIFL